MFSSKKPGRLEELLVERDTEIKELRRLNVELNDENKSLWEMLDEIKKADEAALQCLKEYTDELALTSLENMEPIGEA